MNKAQKKALAKYKSNAEFVIYTRSIPLDMLSFIAKQQDRLYKVIHQRADAKLIGN